MNFQVREDRSFREHARDSDQRVLSVRMCKRVKFFCQSESLGWRVDQRTSNILPVTAPKYQSQSCTRIFGANPPLKRFGGAVKVR